MERQRQKLDFKAGEGKHRMKRWKRTAVAGLFVVALVGSLYAAVREDQSRPTLQRDYDREFTAGSGIRIGTLSELQAESLYKLGKVWGYVKYRHPLVAGGELNWDAELFRVMPKVLEAQSSEAVNEVLYAWLSPWAPDAQAESRTQEAGQEADWLKRQKNGYGLDTSWTQDVSFLGEKLCGYLKELSEVYVTDRGVAYASFAEVEKGLEMVSFEQESRINMQFNAEDDGMRLLALFRFWNCYEYFSPNRSITVKDWDEALRDAIWQMAKAQTQKEYVLALAETAAGTGDGHITVLDRQNTVWNYYGANDLPCSFVYVDGQVVACGITEGKEDSSLRNGDIITELDGISIAERREVLSRYTVLPEPEKSAYPFQFSLLKSEKETAQVKVIRDGEPLTLQVKTRASFYETPHLYQNGLLEEEQIGYLDPSSLKEGDLQKWMKKFADTKGLIVDLRYYPSYPILYALADSLLPEPVQFCRASFPNRVLPGSFYYSDEFVCGGGTAAQYGETDPILPYAGTVVLLMDEGTMSHGEFTVMGLRQAENAVVIGSPSMGADGNITALELPGGVSLNMTGLGIFTPEGAQTQRVGLQPDIWCRPTLEGLRDGRDELVEKAVEVILG